MYLTQESWECLTLSVFKLRQKLFSQTLQNCEGGTILTYWNHQITMNTMQYSCAIDVESTQNRGKCSEVEILKSIDFCFLQYECDCYFIYKFSRSRSASDIDNCFDDFVAIPELPGISLSISSEKKIISWRASLGSLLPR